MTRTQIAMGCRELEELDIGWCRSVQTRPMFKAFNLRYQLKER